LGAKVGKKDEKAAGEVQINLKTWLITQKTFNFLTFNFQLFRTFAPAFGTGRWQDAEFPVKPALDDNNNLTHFKNNGRFN
jgi:hypothetical protein